MSLVAFDFDGTLSASEMTVLLGEQCGVADRMAEITERAMNDELSYPESLRERVSLLDGLSLDQVYDAFSQVALRPGAADVLDALADAGVTTAILTGGFERGVASALDRGGVTVEHVCANRLVDDGEELTGEVRGPLVDGTKDDVLDAVATETDHSLAEAVAIGDGANDRPMLSVCGLAIGYDPKPAVRPVCDVTVDSMVDLLALLRFEGVLPER